MRESKLPAQSGGGLPPSLVGSVALLAVGTGLEWLARRMAGNAARGAAKAAGRALTKRQTTSTPAQPRDEAAVVVNEVIYVRQVQLRR